MRTGLLWCRVLNVVGHPHPLLRSGRGLAIHYESKAHGTGKKRRTKRFSYVEAMEVASKQGRVGCKLHLEQGGLRRRVCVEKKRHSIEAC